MNEAKKLYRMALDCLIIARHNLGKPLALDAVLEAQRLRGLASRKRRRALGAS
jgi:hypothetical protein